MGLRDPWCIRCTGTRGQAPPKIDGAKTMHAFSTIYASSDISDTGLAMPMGISLNGYAPRKNAAQPAAPTTNDPLAGMTPWQIYQRCIWISDEDTNTKISLLCLSRFMDKDLRASSMSYAQWARDCGFSERTAKRCA